MIRRIVVSNFKSLGENVELALGPLTALVGPNGSGKSNAADVLRFLGEIFSRNGGLEDAVTNRHGFENLRRYDAGPTATIAIRVEGSFDDYGLGRPRDGWWEFELGSSPSTEFSIVREAAEVWGTPPFDSYTQMLLRQAGAEPPPRSDGAMLIARFERRGKSWVGEPFIPLAARNSRSLELREHGFVAAAAFDVLSLITLPAIYALFPNVLREPQKPSSANWMREHGENWASVLRRLSKEDRRRDLIAALNRVVGDIDDYRVVATGGYLIPEFHHRRRAGEGRWLGAAQESDGTLRVAGILTALLQGGTFALGIEEPELTVHPGAIPVLFDFIREASHERQVVLTTHSTELLDLLEVDEIRVVERIDGATRIAPLAPEQRDLLRQRLMTPSELLHAEGLRAANDRG